MKKEGSKYEILPKGISKGTVLLKLAQILGIDINKTVALGDYITVSNEEDAIAKSAYCFDGGIYELS